MSKFEKFIQIKTVSKEKLMSEGKSLGSIIGSFFGNFGKMSKLRKDSKAVMLKYDKMVRSNLDKDGNMEIWKANQILDAYEKELQALAKNSGLPQTVIDKYIETVRKEKTIF